MDTTDPDKQPATISKRAMVFIGALSAAWLLVQCAVPLTPLVSHPSEVRTDFSWDMFAVRRKCTQCKIMIQQPGRVPYKLNWGRLYRSSFHVARSRNRQRLPLLAREVCRREQAKGRDVKVFVDCKCRYNNLPTIFDLDPYGDNYCTQEAAARYDR